MMLTFQYHSLEDRKKQNTENLRISHFSYFLYSIKKLPTKWLPEYLTVTSNSTNPKQKLFSFPTFPMPHKPTPFLLRPCFSFITDHYNSLIHFSFFQGIIELITFNLFQITVTITWLCNHISILLKVTLKLPWVDTGIPETIQLSIHRAPYVIAICIDIWAHSLFWFLLVNFFGGCSNFGLGGT